MEKVSTRHASLPISRRRSIIQLIGALRTRADFERSSRNTNKYFKEDREATAKLLDEAADALQRSLKTLLLVAGIVVALCLVEESTHGFARLASTAVWPTAAAVEAN